MTNVWLIIVRPHLYARYCLIAIMFSTINVLQAQLKPGKSISCRKEGEVIRTPLLSDKPCITCICKDGQIKCMAKQCPSNEGCYMILFNKPKNTCCDVCKGCRYKSLSYNSGVEWRSKHNVCHTRFCKANVITRSRIQCYVPCSHPIRIPGQCCPSCGVCAVNGVSIKDGKSYRPPNFPCVKCKCQKGSLSCQKRPCPVLNCPVNKIIKQNGSCCPICKGKRTFFDFVTESCLIRNMLKAPRTSFKLDKCTKCTCIAGTTVCDVENCPVLTCPVNERRHVKGACCTQCIFIPKKNCSFWGNNYQHGSQWQPNTCTTCSCWDGILQCATIDCRPLLKCPYGYRLQYTRGDCCPRCVEAEAVCTVFGDPHYTTFDRKTFSFQGPCKYLLAMDCLTKSFSVRVRNSARQSKHYSWTQTVIIDIDNQRINLLRFLSVKINKRFVSVPYIDKRLFSVFREGYSIVVFLNIGVRVTWDGDSFLEVRIPSKYKGRMCGLCGNYNGIASDDFIGKDGINYLGNAVSFGNSWKLGGQKGCRGGGKDFTNGGSNCEVDHIARFRSRMKCRLFTHPVFLPCLHKVKPRKFIRSCIADVCDCTNRRPCHCASVRAFSRACLRAGIDLSLKAAFKECTEPSCPRGAVYLKCGPGCIRTCDHHLKNKLYKCNKPCREGCHCADQRVWFNNRCVKPARCRYLKRRQRLRKERRLDLNFPLSDMATLSRDINTFNYKNISVIPTKVFLVTKLKRKAVTTKPRLPNKNRVLIRPTPKRAKTNSILSDFLKHSKNTVKNLNILKSNIS